MFDLLLVPVCLITLFLYLTQTLTGHHEAWLVGVSFFIGLGLSLYILRKSIRTINIKNLIRYIQNNLLGVIFILLTLSIIGIVLSPLIISQNLNGSYFIRFPGVFDYYKHSYTITALNTYGIPPKHPFFPPTQFSYYYGYYLIPSALITVFKLDQNSVIYFYTLFTNLISLSCLYWIIGKIIKNNFYSLLGLLTIFFGTAFDVIPAFGNLKTGFVHVENWFGNKETGIIIYNFYTAFLWQPQHILAATMSIGLVYLLYKDKIKPFEIVLISAWVTLSSVFVAITLFWWLLLIFLFKKESRKKLIVSGAWCLLLLIPYLFSLSNRSGVLYYFIFSPYPFSQIKLLNLILTILTEFGFSLLGLILLMIINRRWKSEDTLLFFLAIVIPILSVFFVRSSGPNDFSMKLIIPVEILYSLLFIKLLSETKRNIFKITISILLAISIMCGFMGNVYEYIHRWKDRFVLNYDENNLQQAVRKLPKGIGLSVLNNDEWVYKIPSIGYHSVLSPSLYDAGVYAGNSIILPNNYQYSSKGEEIFINSDSGNDLNELITRRSKLFDQIKIHLSFYDIDHFILSKKIWVKNGLNFWYGLFSKIVLKKTDLTDTYSMFNRKSITDALEKYKIKINIKDVKIINVSDKSFNIEPGFWYISACVDPEQNLIKVEFDEFFTLFQVGKRVDIQCAGQVFYTNTSQKVTFSSTTNVSRINIYPIEVVNKD